MAEPERPLKGGYLWFPPNNVILKPLIKKSWQKRYCKLFKRSNHGKDRLEISGGIEDQKSSNNVSIIPLENCIKIAPDVQKQSNVFGIWTKTPSVHNFSASSEQEMNDWICALQAVAFGDDISRNTIIEEDNDLYCPAGDSGTFSVKLIASDASERCGLKEQWYTLVLTTVALELQEYYENGSLLLSWPYQFIRRYGYKADRLFTFEAGRKCESGEGVFYLENANQQEIFRCMSAKMKQMKEEKMREDKMKEDKMKENLSNDKLRHMIRSRSPLPQLSHNMFDNDLPVKPIMHLPQMLVPPHISSSQLSASQSPPPPPPRMPKNPTKKLQLSYVNECFWETREIESPNSPDYDPVLVSDIRKSKNRDDVDSKKMHSAINPGVPDDGVYDRLQHIGYSSKQVPGYRRIQSIASTNKNTSNVKSDTVMTPARKADDSHYGYGTINRNYMTEESQSNNNFSNPVPHNDLNYAMVLKSNKV